MRALLTVTLLALPAPGLAAGAADDGDSAESAERRVCTRIERYSGSRIAFQRVCLTEAQWRERLGPDWRQRLAGHSPDEDLDEVEVLTRDYSNIGTGGLGGEGAAQPLRPVSGPR